METVCSKGNGIGSVHGVHGPCQWRTKRPAPKPRPTISVEVAVTQMEGQGGIDFALPRVVRLFDDGAVRPQHDVGQQLREGADVCVGARVIPNRATT